MTVPLRSGIIDGQPAYILHSHPYKETSLIIDVLTRDYGRVSMIAKGAKRPTSQWRGILTLFQPLEISFAGRGEVLGLNKVYWYGGPPLPRGLALICAYYINDLLMRLLAREDPHPQIFDDYAQALASLPYAQVEGVLRRFEKQLLRSLGYALDLEREHSQGLAIQSECRYYFDEGFHRLEDGDRSRQHAIVSGQTLLNFAADDYRQHQTRAELKLLLRQIINKLCEKSKARKVLWELMEP